MFVERHAEVAFQTVPGLGRCEIVRIETGGRRDPVAHLTRKLRADRMELPGHLLNPGFTSTRTSGLFPPRNASISPAVCPLGSSALPTCCSPAGRAIVNFNVTPS